MNKKAVVLASLLMSHQVFSQESPTTFVITTHHAEGAPINIKVKTMDSCYFNVFVNNTLVFDTTIGSRGYGPSSKWSDSLMRITTTYPCGLNSAISVVRVKQWKVVGTQVQSINLTSNPFKVYTFCTVDIIKTVPSIKEPHVSIQKFLLNGRKIPLYRRINSPYIRR